MTDNKQDNEFAVSLVSFQCPPTNVVNFNQAEKSSTNTRSRSRTQTQKYSSSNNLNNISSSKEPRERSSSSSRRNQKRTTVAFGLTTNFAETVQGKLEEKLGGNVQKNSTLTPPNVYTSRRMSTSSSGNNSSNRLCLTDRQDDTTITSEIKRNSHRISRLENLILSVEKKSIDKMESIEKKLDLILNNKIPSSQVNDTNEKSTNLSEEKLKEVITKKLKDDIEFKNWLSKEFISIGKENVKEVDDSQKKVTSSSKIINFKNINATSPARGIPLSINSKNYIARQFGKENMEYTTQQSYVQSLVSMDLKEPGSPVVFESNVLQIKKNIQTPKSRYVSEDLLNSPIDQSIIYEETINRQRNHNPKYI
ncbi:Hypothetical protein SRAE_1000121400 [Strongyloides ratti]|uniref:Uncharacterized protein n=1 Tax=Strongyloides ratti TaxID=34506 RepID=A0A090L4A2_STRRB|nr:Hypothetical protein SRAE_1000121400 [Strongyloides ratti]CEF62947.1 Hypothetical protein SRAE_1000121400 [Strongyloides ratti]